MAFGDVFGSLPSPLVSALQNRAGGQAYTPAPYNPLPGIDMSQYQPQVQTEMGNLVREGNAAQQGYLQQRQGFGGQLQNDLMAQIQAGLTASTPDIENRLNSLGILQSGAYPSALGNQAQSLLANSVLPALTAFDTQTFNTASGIPLQTTNSLQNLGSASLGRTFGLQDQQTQMNFQQGLANQMQKTQQLQALLGLVPSLIGSQGIGGLFGGPGGGFGGGMGGTGGGGGLGGDLSSTIGGLLGGSSGLGSVLGSAGLGALGPALGGALGLGGVGQGVLGGIGGLLGGGGVLGGLGGGLGGAFGGPLGGAIGAGTGDLLNQWVQGQGGWSGLAGDLGGLFGSDSGMSNSNPSNLPVMLGANTDQSGTPLPQIFDPSMLAFNF